MSIALLLSSALFAVGQAEAFEVYQDLRQGRDIRKPLRLTGPLVSKYALPEAEGLRFTLPAGREKWGPVGLQTDIAVPGDFDVVGTYEILAAEAPTQPRNGVGVNLYIVQGDDGNRFAKIGRYNTKLHGHAYGWQHTDRRLAAPSTVTDFEPTAATTGQLRLVRRGTMLSFQVKDRDTGGDFKELFAREFGDDPLTMIRFVVNSSEETRAVDARLLDLRIRTGDVPAPAATEPEGPTEDAPSADAPRFLWIAAGLSSVFILGVAAFFWRLRRRAEGEREPRAAALGFAAKRNNV